MPNIWEINAKSQKLCQERYCQERWPHIWNIYIYIYIYILGWTCAFHAQSLLQTACPRKKCSCRETPHPPTHPIHPTPTTPPQPPQRTPQASASQRSRTPVLRNPADSWGIGKQKSQTARHALSWLRNPTDSWGVAYPMPSNPKYCLVQPVILVP